MPMFAWDDLRYFLAAYRAGSIGRACEVLDVSGSTVSRRLAALEEALGTALFVRSPEGLIPTPAAQAMLDAAESAEASARRIHELAHQVGVPTGVVRVSMPGDMTRIVLTGVLPELRRAYPEIVLELVETHELVDLARLEADIAVRTVRPSSGDLVMTRLREVHMGLFAARSVIDEFGDDPLRMPWIGWVTEVGSLAEARWFEANLAQVSVVARVNTLTTMRLLAGAGLGAAALPRLFGQMTPHLVELVSPIPLPPGQLLWLVCNASLRHTPRVAAVWSFLEAQLRARPLELEHELLRERLARTQGIHFERPR